MKSSRKRVVLHVAWILSLAFVIGEIVSLSLAANHGSTPSPFWELIIGAAGPFFVLLNDGPLSWAVAALVLGLLFTPIAVGIAKRRLLPAVIGAVLLALAWLGAVFTVCIMTHLS